VRAAQEEPGLIFNPWPDTSLPSASMPALEAGRCAQYQGGEAFEHFHFALFREYSEKNRDISSRDVLLDIARDSGLDTTHLASDMDNGQGRAELAHERDAILAPGDFIGVPTVVFGNNYPLEGAIPIQVYQRAMEKLMKQDYT